MFGSEASTAIMVVMHWWMSKGSGECGVEHERSTHVTKGVNSIRVTASHRLSHPSHAPIYKAL